MIFMFYLLILISKKSDFYCELKYKFIEFKYTAGVIHRFRMEDGSEPVFDDACRLRPEPVPFWSCSGSLKA
ncbi:hypothetical protein AQ619_01890 [Caulobacter henricii]|uniref:Uncharacterized protein n=1 Tax=Caulobacter henricii TaxID=69395 RepID=A0A0P0NW40_9CAUL|nr:hypothetical protein AQ619_01890 [Caulobacter henricii]